MKILTAVLLLLVISFIPVKADSRPWEPVNIEAVGEAVQGFEPGKFYGFVEFPQQMDELIILAINTVYSNTVRNRGSWGFMVEFEADPFLDTVEFTYLAGGVRYAPYRVHIPLISR